MSPQQDLVFGPDENSTFIGSSERRRSESGDEDPGDREDPLLGSSDLVGERPRRVSIILYPRRRLIIREPTIIVRTITGSSHSWLANWGLPRPGVEP